MPADTLKLFDAFLEQVNEGVHNFNTDQLAVALTNTLPSVSTDSILTDIIEISYTNLSSRNLTTSGSSEAGGTYMLTVDDLTLTAGGGSVGPFQYVVIYNETATADQLVGFLDYGSALTLADGEELLLDFSAVNGILQAVEA